MATNTPSPAAGSKELRSVIANEFVHIRNKTSMGRSKSITNVMQLITAQNNATYEAVMDTFPEKAFGAPAGEYETGGECGAYADGYNQACAELRQSIAKIYGKGSNVQEEQ